MASGRDVSRFSLALRVSISVRLKISSGSSLRPCRQQLSSIAGSSTFIAPPHLERQASIGDSAKHCGRGRAYAPLRFCFRSRAAWLHGSAHLPTAPWSCLQGGTVLLLHCRLTRPPREQDARRGGCPRHRALDRPTG